MATSTIQNRRPTALTGKPAIQNLRTIDLPNVQAAINNIAERFRNVEALTNTLLQVADATSSGDSIKSLQSQITSLSASFNALAAQVAAVDQGSTILSMESKMRSIAQEAVSRIRPDDANAILANRVFGGYR